MNVDVYTNLPFHLALDAIKKESNLSFAQMSKMTGFTSQYLNLLINGKRGVPKPENIEKIARGLSVSPDYFMEYRFLKIREGLMQDSELERETFLKISERISSYKTQRGEPVLKDEQEEIDYYISKASQFADLLAEKSGRKDLNIRKMSLKEKRQLANLVKEFIDRINNLQA
ncbi:MAG: helix-turn-helix domain-containing protein [Actinobacteria bacterium]|nr:helix-turn-helix domain-containing protein [Actinomycetota bacterium]